MAGSESGAPGAGVRGGGAPGSGAAATASDRVWLRQAIALSRRCPPSPTAFAVGAVLVTAGGSVLATGYSRESDPHDHAEEAALAKLPGQAQAGSRPSAPADAGALARADAVGGEGVPGLSAATLYSSLEPCRYRASRPRPCAELIIEAGVRRVVIAWLEPPVFAAGGGAALLRESGVTVVEVPELAAEARAVNAPVVAD